jgi:hypothetical protein
MVEAARGWRRSARRITRCVFVACVTLGAAGCRDEPPRSLAGFALGMSQERAMAEARSHGGFTCSVRGTQPRQSVCEGDTPDGPVRVLVHQDTLVEVTVRMDPDVRNPRRAMRHFVRKFGEPAWRERPYPSRFAPLEGHHTLWLDRDSTRSVALVCDGPRLEPPCLVELAATSPARVLATLDSLLEISDPHRPSRAR